MFSTTATSALPHVRYVNRAFIVAQEPEISPSEQPAFSSHDNYPFSIPVSAVMGRGTVVTVERARATATVYSPFQNYHRITRTTILLYLSIGGIYSLV